MPQPRIEIEQLSKVFYSHLSDTFKDQAFNKASLSPEDKVVLDDISFVLTSGETIGMIGRNGAGKSTLLSILAGISKPTHGKLNICGKVTAVMTLGVGLREDLTGKENIYLDGQLQGKSYEEINAVIDEIIEFSELNEFIEKPVKTYSTGMKSRLAFSMLVGIEPEILIIDEALSAGDAFFAEKASKKIREICKKGKIVIIVSHSMAAIESMCTRCIWLERGRVCMDGVPTLVTKSYLESIQEEEQRQELNNVKDSHLCVSENAQYKILEVDLRCKESEHQQHIFTTKDRMIITLDIYKYASCSGRLFFIIASMAGVVLRSR